MRFPRPFPSLVNTTDAYNLFMNTPKIIYLLSKWRLDRTLYSVIALSLNHIFHIIIQVPSLIQIHNISFAHDQLIFCRHMFVYKGSINDDSGIGMKEF